MINIQELNVNHFYWFLSQFSKQRILIKNQATDGAGGFIEYQYSYWKYIALLISFIDRDCEFDPLTNFMNVDRVLLVPVQIVAYK